MPCCSPAEYTRQKARTLLKAPDIAWSGRGMALGPGRQVGCALVAVWLPGCEPCLGLTDLRPRQVQACGYGLRMGIKDGFRILKRLGWQWQKTRRTDPDRAARHWLVLAVVTLWTRACGTPAEDALSASAPATPQRLASGFRRGLMALNQQLAQGRLHKRLTLRSLTPPGWPPSLRVPYHSPPTRA